MLASAGPTYIVSADNSLARECIAQQFKLLVRDRVMLYMTARRTYIYVYTSAKAHNYRFASTSVFYRLNSTAVPARVPVDPFGQKSTFGQTLFGAPGCCTYFTIFFRGTRDSFVVGHVFRDETACPRRPAQGDYNKSLQNRKSSSSAGRVFFPVASVSHSRLQICWKLIL